VDELLVRNPKVPITKVEVKSANHSRFVELRRETDGTLNDDGGFGSGPFTLRISRHGRPGPDGDAPGFSAGQIITATVQFS